VRTVNVMAVTNKLPMLHTFWNQCTKSGGFDAIFKKVKVISGGEGKCEAEFTVEKEHTNFMGYLHGGFSASIVDMVSSMALLTHPKHNAGVSVNLSVSYLKGAQIGEEILVKAHTDRVAKKLAFLSVQIINKETGDLIALGSHTKYLL